jgi:hypothetical protein
LFFLVETVQVDKKNLIFETGWNFGSPRYVPAAGYFSGLIRIPVPFNKIQPLVSIVFYPKKGKHYYFGTFDPVFPAFFTILAGRGRSWWVP